MRNADLLNRQLDEDNFHDIVNDEDQMYDDIEAISVDGDNMVNQILAIAKNHVSEVWSPPRVNILASQYGLQPGFSYDIQTDDENGNPWDFDIPAQRAKCIRNIIEQKPAFVIGSPMCTAFSALQGLNSNRMSKDKWDALWEKGVRHMQFAINIYKLQVESGRYFIHEHPNSASSWKIPEMIKFMNEIGVDKVVSRWAHVQAWYEKS